MTIKIVNGDALTVLRTIKTNCIQCVVTSPPYFGLRDYGTASWQGGDVACTHRAPDDAGATTKPSAGQREHAGRFAGPTCYLCGATRIDSQIGLEPNPNEYVMKLVEVFREVRRVLRDDGTLWLNLGDSYAGSWGNQGRKQTRGTQRPVNGAMLQVVNDGRYPDKQTKTGSLKNMQGLKLKDLIGTPWRVAFALQQDGWYLRQDIIWAKPNPMPESVRDRCTKSHEYLFMFSKQPRYYFDADAIAEPTAVGYNGSTFTKGKTAQHLNHTMQLEPRVEKATRNRRSVWTITTKPFKEAHFATFPPDLVQPCILAGSPELSCILDPFAGSGTVGLVANTLRRHAILIELNPEYCQMAERRCGLASPALQAAE